MNPDPNHRSWNSFLLRFQLVYILFLLLASRPCPVCLKQLIKWSDYWSFTLWVWGLNLGGWKGEKRNVNWIYIITESEFEMCRIFLWIWKWYTSLFLALMEFLWAISTYEFSFTDSCQLLSFICSPFSIFLFLSKFCLLTQILQSFCYLSIAIYTNISLETPS